jgi:hypothetical protein
MRKSAKRGEPQIFPLCVTLWMFSRSHVHGMMLCLSRPPKARSKQNTALGLDVRAWGPFFFGGCRNLAAQNRCPHSILPLSGRASPFLEQKHGTNVKEAATTAALTAGLTPDDRCPRKRHVWGTRQRRWFLTWPAPLLCLTQPFCARGHIAKNRNAVRWACV